VHMAKDPSVPADPAERSHDPLVPRARSTEGFGAPGVSPIPRMCVSDSGVRE
jgi:hypothetical protein